MAIGAVVIGAAGMAAYAAVLYQQLGFYKDWGGKGWSGGSNDPNNIDWNKPGRDLLDEAFKSHDRGYYDAEQDLKNGVIDKDTYDRRIYDTDINPAIK